MNGYPTDESTLDDALFRDMEQHVYDPLPNGLVEQDWLEPPTIEQDWLELPQIERDWLELPELEQDWVQSPPLDTPELDFPDLVRDDSLDLDLDL